MVARNIFSNKNWLNIHTNKYGGISFITDNAEEISEEISKRVTEFEEETLQKQKLEDTQIKSRNLDAIPPARFEELISQIFQSMGYIVHRTGHTGDEGIDIICNDKSKNEKIIVQCKRYRGKVGVHFVREFYGAMIHSNANKGYIVTTGEFTQPAINWASGKQIELINRKRLADMLNSYIR